MKISDAGKEEFDPDIFGKSAMLMQKIILESQARSLVDEVTFDYNENEMANQFKILLANKNRRKAKFLEDRLRVSATSCKEKRIAALLSEPVSNNNEDPKKQNTDERFGSW